MNCNIQNFILLQKPAIDDNNAYNLKIYEKRKKVNHYILLEERFLS